LSGIINDRLGYLRAKLAGVEELRHISLRDALKSTVSWYGMHRWLITRHLASETLNDRMDWITVRGLAVAWPKQYSLSRLVGALAELWAPQNAHYYFHPLTVVRKGDIVLDVGASEGAFAVECLTRYGADQVWCFEPEPSMTDALRSTAERSGLAGRLQIVPAAVTSVSGRVRILENADDPLASYLIEENRPNRNGMVAGASRDVEAVSIDDWVERAAVRRINYMKIDAEGSDLAVLEGARGCLVRWKPAIAVTTYHRPEHCNAIIAYLSSLRLGYRFKAKGVIAFDGIPRPVMVHAAIQ
jgi:FkbM family methyltransferase